MIACTSLSLEAFLFVNAQCIAILALIWSEHILVPVVPAFNLALALALFLSLMLLLLHSTSRFLSRSMLCRSLSFSISILLALFHAAVSETPTIKAHVHEKMHNRTCKHTQAPIEIARLGEGDTFGEMSLILGDPRTATVVALGHCECIR